ncbi:MAG: FHA domain-containing protein [bacterium]
MIGRGEQADVRVDDDAMSRRHTEISYRNLEFRVRDLESSNGTFLNGSEVKEYALRNGDKIMAGETLFSSPWIGSAHHPR